MISALVIDDNRQTADSLCDMLRLLEIQAMPLYGARTAVLELSKQVPDVIFLDINMPGVSGYEVLSYIRRDPRLRDVPVFMVTSDDQPQTAERARKTGALLTIVKPVTVEAIENALKRIGLTRL
ncbi:MAG: response regulator [Anaerolineales bacterium]|jgi:CheY-like chemotaxis protein